MRKIKRHHKREAEVKKGLKLIPPELRGPLLYILLIIFLPFVITYAVELIHKRQFPLSHAEWKLYSPSQSRLSLLLPGEPQAVIGNAPETDLAILRVDRHQVVIEQFRMSLWEVSYREGTLADLRQAVPLVSAALRESGEVAEYKENLAPAKHRGHDSLLVSGTFNRGGQQQHFRAMMTAEGDRLWQVVVAHPASYRLAAKAAQRVIDSIRLN